MTGRSADPLEMGAERKRSLQQVVCYRGRAETEGLHVEERREGEYLKIACSPGLGSCFY